MKTLLISFSFLACSFFSFSQNNWLRHAGGANHDEALDMAATSDGHFAVVGYFASGAIFGGVSLSSSGLSDAFVQKVDAQGTTVWAIKMGGIKPDRATSVACDDNGNIYVTGFFSEEANFGPITLDEAGDSLEIFITKLNSDGEVQWARACGGVSDDYSYGIAVDDESNVIVTGKFREVGHFGNLTLTSEMYDDNSYWSYDVFTTKLDTDGNWLWAEKGSASDDDRGLSVTTDNYNNIYVCGQFSDTITFDQTHLNDVGNAGFLIKYNPNGDEQWFDKLAASQLVTYDVTTDQDHNILLTGEYSGQMAIFNDNIDFVPADYVFNIFLSKFGQSGDMLWTSHAGSGNLCSAKAVCVGAENEAYVTGTFNCVMEEFSDEYGEGIFNSAGFRDVFVTRFDSNGDRTWERQFASSKDDFCSAIAYQGIEDKPLIAGSFSNFFNVPSNNQFNFYPENEVPWGYNLPNCEGYPMCFDNYYGSFVNVQSTGNKDIFFASPVNLMREPYDYYDRNLSFGSDCNRPVVNPCINGYMGFECDGFNTCSDTIVICHEGSLVLDAHTGSEGFIGPAYIYDWDNQGYTNEIWVSTGGFYSVDVTTEDGCSSYADDVFVIVSPLQCPLVMDDLGFNDVATCTPLDAAVCYPNPIEISATGFVSDYYFWAYNMGAEFYFTDTLVAPQEGAYSFGYEDTLGCYWYSDSIHIDFVYTLDTISPYLSIDGIANPDSIYVNLCDDGMDCLDLSIFDYLPSDYEIFEENVQVDWQFFHNDLPYEGGMSNVNYCFQPMDEGWFHVLASPVLEPDWPCTGYEPYPVIDAWFHLEYTEMPFVDAGLEGELFICPGDTTLLTGSGGNDYNWYEITDWGGLNWIEDNDSILISDFGSYELFVSTTFEGCISRDSIEFQVQSKPDPYVWMDPYSGVICPGDSVQLWCEEGLEYHWMGPLGTEIGNTQSIFVTVPGFYFCILTDYSGCILESNMVEVKEYSTPYLIAYPGTELCVNGQVLIQLATNDYESIQWGDPFYDSATEQWIYEAGTYEVSVTSCGITTETTITITDTDTPAFITPSEEIFCPNDTIILVANPGMQGYLWQPGNIPYEELEVTEPGTYALTTYDELGCMGIAYYDVYAYEIESPVAEGTIICAGESTVLNSVSDNPVYWSDDEYGDEILANGYSFSTPIIDEETTYYVFSVDEVCDSYPTEVVVEVYFSSLPPIIGGDDSICLGADALLISPMEEGMNYLWTLPDGTTSSADTLFINNAGEDDEGDYMLTVEDENCTSSEILSFEVIPQEILQLDADNYLEVCVGSMIQISSPVEAEIYSWSTPNGDFNGPQTLIINAAAEINAGEYYLTLTNAVCEFEVLPISVDVNPYPDLIADPCTWFCEDGYMTIGFMENYDWYLWSTGDSTATVAVPDTGWYSVQVANDPNCIVTTEVHVPTMECIEGFINVITCNGDGRNDFADFGVLRGQIDAVYIYNRWGNILKTLTPSNLVWDGTGRVGEKVSTGVYFYTIDYAATQKSDCGCYLPPEGYIHVFAEE